MKFLITSGGTVEPIDAVRVLTNISSGHTGAVLATYLLQKNHDVTLLRSIHAEPVPKTENIVFDSFKSLDAALRALLAHENFDVIIHAAAVSDFTVDKISQQGKEISVADQQKIKSGLPLVLYLKPTFKVIDRLLQYASNRPTVVGFKLTSGANPDQVKEAVLKVKADWVVHNDMTDIRARRRIFTIYQQGTAKKHLSSVEELAAWLSDLHKV